MLAFARQRANSVISRQSGRNAIFSVGSTLANPILALVTTPFLFTRLGNDSFGAWALINTLLAVSGAASLGLGDAATKYVALHQARNDNAHVIRVVQCVLTMHWGMAVMIAALLNLFAPWLVKHLFKTTVEGQIDATIALRIGALGFTVRAIYGVLEAVVRGYNRYDLEARWSLFNTVVSNLVAVACVGLGLGLKSVLIGGIVVQLFGAFRLAQVAMGLIGSYTYLRPSLDNAVLREVSSFGVFTWLQALNGIVIMQLDRIVIGAALGAAQLGYYTICLQLVQILHTTLARGCAFLFPLVVKYRENGRQAELGQLFRTGMFLITNTGWLMSGCLLVFGSEFLRIWMGQEFAEQATQSLKALAIWNAFMATSIVPFYFLNATGEERINAVCGWISAGIFVLGAIALIPVAGPLGASLARVLTSVAGLINRTVLLRRVFGDTRWFAGIVTFVPIGTAVSLCILLQWTSKGYFGIPRQLAIYLSSSVVCMVASYLVYGRFLGDMWMPQRLKSGLSTTR